MSDKKLPSSAETIWKGPISRAVRRRDLGISIRIHARRRLRPARGVALRDFIIAALIVLAVVAAIAGWLPGSIPAWKSSLVVAGYFVCAHVVQIHIGDNFEMSFRRRLRPTLIYLGLLLLPGRYVTESIVTFIRYRSLPTVDDLLQKDRAWDADLFR